MSDNENAHVENSLEWTVEALGRLQKVPEGVMREMARQRVENLAQRQGQSLVTVEHMDAKYRTWEQGSAQAVSQIGWTEEAHERIERVPSFVRGMVAKAIEVYAAQQGLEEITSNLIEEVKNSWGESGRFH